jgi:hypothetical protein
MQNLRKEQDYKKGRLLDYLPDGIPDAGRRHCRNRGGHPYPLKCIVQYQEGTRIMGKIKPITAWLGWDKSVSDV